MSSLRRFFPRTAVPVEEYEKLADELRRSAWDSIAPADRYPSPASYDFFRRTNGEIKTAEGQWTVHTVEEVFERMRAGYEHVAFELDSQRWGPVDFAFYGFSDRMTVTVSSDDDDAVVRRWMAKWADVANRHALPNIDERPVVFIGHGGHNAWTKIRDFLLSLGCDVLNYESLPHTGRTIERVLADALERCNFALLVMTGEDQRPDRSVQARQNVVHELGLFQGKLGWDNAIVMLEDGVDEFSNIAGTNQLRFPVGEPERRFGDIVIALKERFPAFMPS